jgi:hypothetical protein
VGVEVGNKKSTQTGNMDGQNIDHEPCTSVHTLQITLIRNVTYRYSRG